jgi:hypothetical protein
MKRNAFGRSWLSRVDRSSGFRALSIWPLRLTGRVFFLRMLVDAQGLIILVRIYAKLGAAYLQVRPGGAAFFAAL